MAAVDYPDSLPCPRTAPFVPADRVRRSDLPGLMQFVGKERDFRGTQEVSFVFSDIEAQIFDNWWRNTLDRGGRFFSTHNWPLTAGWVVSVVRRCTAPPQWSAIGKGYWLVTLPTELRGRGLAPDVWARWGEHTSGFALSSDGLTLSEGSNNDEMAFAESAYSSGRWYWELTFTFVHNELDFRVRPGIRRSDTPVGTSPVEGKTLVCLSSSGVLSKGDSVADTALGVMFDENDVFMCALDMDLRKFSIGVNGTWTNGDPTNPDNWAFDAFESGSWYPFIWVNNDTNIYTVTLSRASTAAFTPPTGYVHI